MVQFFEIAFEQSWKVLKDFLEEEGFDVKRPRKKRWDSPKFDMLSFFVF